MDRVSIHVGDCRESMRGMEAGSVQCVVTSPPYFGLRDYGHAGQIGLEPTPDEFVSALVEVFREVRRVLRDDGTVWLNLGDSYATDSKWGGSTGGKASKGIHGLGGGGRNKTSVGLPDKNLIGIPWRVAFALQADGWYLRQDIIWHKPNPMPESVKDRCTKAHEYIFLLTKSPRYFFDGDAIKESAVGPVGGATGRGKQKSAAAYAINGGQPQRDNSGGLGGDGVSRNRRSVWTVTTKPFKGAHFATFPPELIEPCIKAGSRHGDTVLDPFGGAGTTGLVSARLNRNSVLCELNPEYAELARTRLDDDWRGPSTRKGLGKKSASAVPLLDIDVDETQTHGGV